MSHNYDFYSHNPDFECQNSNFEVMTISKLRLTFYLKIDFECQNYDFLSHNYD